ncbi:MAG: hypothetical protein ACJ8R9_08065 [Steroidobacteraceae bacterium]
MIGSRARWAFTAVSLALGGCGNAYEHISVGEWQEVGQAQPPVPVAKGAFVITTHVAGNGPMVSPGDLVKARVRTHIGPPRVQTVWVWTGREPTSAGWEQRVADRDTYGDLGLGRARIALIGRRLNEHFEINLEPGAEQYVDAFPVRGIIESRYATLNRAAQIRGRWVAPPEWPALPLGDSAVGLSSADIEIINICKARLFRRTATLEQRGIVLTTADAGYPTERRGTLGWTAIDAQCPGPDGHIHFQAGPFHHSGGGERSQPSCQLARELCPTAPT